MNASTQDERDRFSQRLTGAIIAAGFQATTSAFTLRFNSLAGGTAVTTHGVRKWLTGESIPTHPRMLVIAKMLSVSPAWLRFGEGDDASVLPNSTCGNAAPEMLLSDLRLLSERNFRLVHGLVESLLQAQQGLDRK